MTLVPIDESKDTLKKHEELWSKIRDLIISKTNNSDDYDEKYAKIKFNSDDNLHLKKSLEFSYMIIVFRNIFLEDNQLYPQVLLD